MQIREADWQRYIRRLSAIDRRAAERMQAWLERNPNAERSAMLNYAYNLSSVFGEAACALACEMYDSVAIAQGAVVQPAAAAETATFPEVAKAVNGTLLNMHSTVPQTVSRLVKQAGADTMLHNAIRDGAEWAWIPSGDTCAFCIMLASNGWQRQGRKASRGQHAEHIHANCDCTYAVRFDGVSGVQGYDPERYLETYNGAEGKTWREKLNSMRRDQYAEEHPGGE